MDVMGPPSNAREGATGDTYRSIGNCTYSAVGLSIPLDKETGAVPDNHPLQMRRHGEPTEETQACLRGTMADMLT